MVDQHTLILHGWSDCSRSFIDLKNRLDEKNIGNVDTILYGDYESREDNITFNDVVGGLNDQMIDKELINPDGTRRTDLNVIVHSTGGLVIRHWIWRYYKNRIEECPIKRIVMLAPANFGSPLAHRGKSFMGRIAKGRWKIGDFLEVGRQLLHGLELGSPYQWELAHRDLFYGKKSYFNRNQIQLTILTGIEDYDGVKGWVNKPGTDGTVVIAGTSLDSIKLEIDFSDPSSPFEWKEKETAHDFGFGVLEGLDHGSIIGKFRDPNSQITALTVEALSISSPDEFKIWQDKLESITEKTYQEKQNVNTDKNKQKYSKYQQFIIRAVDDHDAPVTDYTIDFYVYKAVKAEKNLIESTKRSSKKEDDLSKEFHNALIKEIHKQSVDPSYRRLLVNLDEVDHLIEKGRIELEDFVLSMRIFVPSIDKGIYYDLNSLQNVVIYSSVPSVEKAPSLFFENTTTLIEMKISRKTRYVSIGTKSKK